MGPTTARPTASDQGVPRSVVVVLPAVRMEAMCHDPSNSRSVLATTSRPHDIENR